MPDRQIGKLRVVATIFPAYDFVRQIAGDAVSLKIIIPPGGDSHEYEPTLSDLADFRDSDLIFYSGTEADEWFESIDESVFANAEAVPLHTYVSAGDGDDGLTDDHEWISLRNAVKMAEGICGELCAADSNNANIYKDNRIKFETELKALDGEFTEIAEKSDIKTVCFAGCSPFNAFFDDYGLESRAVFDGCAEGSEPNLSRIAAVCDAMHDMKIATVFYTDPGELGTARFICDKTGSAAVQFYSMQNIPKEKFTAGETYISLTKHNLKALGKALRHVA